MENEVDILNQYLTFTIDKENYAINVANIREVLEFQGVSRVPRMPDFMRGIINLRGKVVPVIDLKIKFGLGETLKGLNTSVIVTELLFENDQIIMGLLTDSVSEVIELEEDEIEDTPYIGTKIEAAYIRGLGKKNGKFIIILDIEKVLISSKIQELVADAII